MQSIQIAEAKLQEMERNFQEAENELQEAQRNYDEKSNESEMAKQEKELARLEYLSSLLQATEIDKQRASKEESFIAAERHLIDIYRHLGISSCNEVSARDDYESARQKLKEATTSVQYAERDCNSKNDDFEYRLQDLWESKGSNQDISAAELEGVTQELKISQRNLEQQKNEMVQAENVLNQISRTLEEAVLQLNTQEAERVHAKREEQELHQQVTQLRDESARAYSTSAAAEEEYKEKAKKAQSLGLRLGAISCNVNFKRKFLEDARSDLEKAKRDVEDARRDVQDENQNYYSSFGK